jgi:anthranilate phosphoribosyltransferase
VMSDLVAGVPGPVQDIVVLNAAAALLALAGPTGAPIGEQLPPHVAAAREAIASGAAQDKLRRWVASTQRAARGG